MSGSPPLIVVLGGVASGKSKAMRLFAEKGVAVFDADESVHQLSCPGEAGWQAVYDTFGESVLLPNGTLNRAWLRTRAFSDRQVRITLENIFHPLVDQHLQQLWYKASSVYVMVVFPLIPHATWLKRARRVLVVDASYLLRLSRVKQHRAYTTDLFCQMIRAQASRLSYLSLADDVLFNDNSLEALSSAVHDVHLAYLSRFSSST